jgi:hypothetical protein
VSVNFMITTVFKEMGIFWIWKKKKCCFFFVFFQKNSEPNNAFLSSFLHYFAMIKKKWNFHGLEFFLEKHKKKQHFFFKFKIASFPLKQSYNHKIHRQYTLGSKLKISQWNCHKNRHLLIFYEFGQIWGFQRLICGFLKS